MGGGPNGSGVVIKKPDTSAPKETHQERELRIRQDRARRMHEHEARQAAFAKQQTEHHDDKMLRRVEPTKAAVEPATVEDLAAMSDAALTALAEERGIDVVAADGPSPTRDDYLRALGG